MAETEYMPRNVEKDPMYNREPGIVKIPGSNLAKEMAKFEQFPSEWGAPGNPYKFRPFPKMLYRAQHWNGKPVCMAAEPNRVDYHDVNLYKQDIERAKRFNVECTRIVNDESEMAKAMEGGWRESPAEAVEFLLGRDRTVANETAIRNHEDRNLSEAAKLEAARAVEEVGGEHLPEIPEKPIRRRGRPKGSKNKA